MTITDVLRLVDLDADELGMAAAWCLDQLAERLSESGSPHEAARQLGALREPIGSLNQLFSDGAANFRAADPSIATSAGQALEQAALATADLAKAHQRATAAVQAALNAWEQAHANPGHRPDPAPPAVGTVASPGRRGRR